MMLSKKYRILFPLFILLSASAFLPVRADQNEVALKDAIEKANQGHITEAIADLEKLKTQMPQDSRLALSLGLLYQQNDQHDQAIAEIERSVSQTPTLQGYFALGLLYESKWVHTDDASWKDKAIRAWETYVQMAPLDSPYRQSADRHLKKLRNNG